MKSFSAWLNEAEDRSWLKYLPKNSDETNSVIHQNRLTTLSGWDKKEIANIGNNSVIRYEKGPAWLHSEVPGANPSTVDGQKIVDGFKKLLHNPATRVPKELGAIHLFHGMSYGEPKFDGAGRLMMGNAGCLSTSTSPEKAMQHTRESKYKGDGTHSAHHLLVIHHPNDDDHHIVSLKNMFGTRTEDEVIMPPSVLRKVKEDEYVGDHHETGKPIYVYHAAPELPHPTFMDSSQFSKFKGKVADVLKRDKGGTFRLK